MRVEMILTWAVSKNLVQRGDGFEGERDKIASAVVWIGHPPYEIVVLKGGDVAKRGRGGRSRTQTERFD
jgi:hypothetical protein